MKHLILIVTVVMLAMVSRIPLIILALFGILTMEFIACNFVRSGNKPVKGNLSLRKA